MKKINVGRREKRNERPAGMPFAGFFAEKRRLNLPCKPFVVSNMNKHPREKRTQNLKYV
jgi:hypothetical protein